MPATNPGTTGLVAWWSFADTLTDAHSGGYTLTGVGSPTYADGNGPTRCIEFSGTGQYVQRTTSAWSFPGNAASLSVWLKLDAATPADSAKTGIMQAGATLGGNNHYPFTNGLVYLDAFRTSREVITPSGGVSRAAWHLLTITTTASGSWLVYQNTTLVHTASANATVTISDGTQIFRLGASATAGTYAMDGQMQRASLWLSELSADNVTWLYNAGVGRSYASLTASSTSPFQRIAAQRAAFA